MKTKILLGTFVMIFQFHKTELANSVKCDKFPPNEPNIFFTKRTDKTQHPKVLGNDRSLY